MKTYSKNHITNILRKIKLTSLKIYRAQGSDHEIALGATIGVFWGVFPTFGLSTLLTLILFKFIRFNLPVAISAAFISNPLTSPFLLLTSYQVGSFFVDTGVKFEYENWAHNLSKLGLVMLIGSTIVSSVSALLIYFMVKYILKKKKEFNSKKIT